MMPVVAAPIAEIQSLLDFGPAQQAPTFGCLISNVEAWIFCKMALRVCGFAKRKSDSDSTCMAENLSQLVSISWMTSWLNILNIELCTLSAACCSASNSWEAWRWCNSDAWLHWQRSLEWGQSLAVVPERLPIFWPSLNSKSEVFRKSKVTPPIISSIPQYIFFYDEYIVSIWRRRIGSFSALHISELLPGKPLQTWEIPSG